MQWASLQQSCLGLCASWTCVSISFTKLGKFSFIIFSNRFPVSYSFSYLSGTPVMQMLDCLKLFQRLLTLSSFFWIPFFLVLFKKDFIYLFLDRGEGREKEMERNINVCLSLMYLLLGPGLQPSARCPEWESVTLWFSGQHSTHRATPARAILVVLIGLIFAPSCSKSLIWFSASSTLLLFLCKLFFISTSVSFVSDWIFFMLLKSSLSSLTSL